MLLKALLAAATLIAAPLTASTSYAFTLDATETLSSFKVDGDVQETPTQLLLTHAVITYTSSKRGAISEPLRLDYEHPVVGATAVCLSFGATKVVDYSGQVGTGSERVLIVDLTKGKTAFNWSRGDESYIVTEILCEK